MAYKDLLVHVDDSNACKARIDAAIELASRFDAHLTALYLVPEIILPVAAEAIWALMSTPTSSNMNAKGTKPFCRSRPVSTGRRCQGRGV